ncbi:40s ribosomal protein s3ae-a, partial [Jimgerdemannia flammicorona]
KKIVNPFTYKDWYDIKAPCQVGKTLGHIIKVSLRDLSKDEEHAFCKIKLCVDEIQGKNCLTNFHGMDFTSDKLRSLLHKTTYVQSGQIHQIYKKMFDIMTQEATSYDLKEVIAKFITSSSPNVQDTISYCIKKACQDIYLLQNVYIHKVKILKVPKFDVQKLLELHGSDASDADIGTKVNKDFVEPV